MGMAKPESDMSGNGQSHGSGRPTPDVGSAPLSGGSPEQAETPAGRWLYADKPLEPGDGDSLSFGAYADALALLMDWKETSTPLTIAINGPWGSGKTSLAKMAEARLPIGSDWDAPHVICWFDAWANDDAPHLGAAFAAAVALAVNKQRRWWTRLMMPLPSVMLTPEQRWRRGLWLGVLTVVLAAVAIFWPTGGSLLTPFLHPGATISDLGHGTVATRLAWPVLVVAVIILTQRLAPSIQGVARWIDNPGSEAARGSMQDASRQLRRLIDQALRGKRRLMIFVDNLERCRPPRAVEVCEVVSQLIGHPEVVTVLIGDMDTIALSAEIKYAALESVSPGITITPGPGGARRISDSRSVGTYGRAYLEKLIQIQLRLPPPLPSDLRKMLVPVANERPAFPPDPATLISVDVGSPTGPTSFRAVTWVRITFLILLGVVAYVLVAPGHSSPWVLAVLATTTAVLTSLPILSERVGERRHERARQTLDKEVYDVVKPTETALTQDAEQELLQRLGQVVPITGGTRGMVSIPSVTGPATIRRRMRQRIISGNELRAELDRAVLEVLPLSPRAAKRMFNHAHLLLDIGVERGVFATQPGLKATQLAAWVALTERWPFVAAAITSEPTLLGRLEEIARHGSHESLRPEELAAIGDEMGMVGLDSSLLDYLRRSDSLVSCVRLLVNFSPDAGKESASAVEA
jgi:hypothetical protein